MAEKQGEKWHLIEGPKPLHWKGAGPIAFLIRAEGVEAAHREFMKIAWKRMALGRGKLRNPLGKGVMHDVLQLGPGVEEIIKKYFGGRIRDLKGIRYLAVHEHPEMMEELRKLRGG